MRKVLIIAFGLASLGALAGVQPALAGFAQSCVQTALDQCNSLGGQCTNSPQYLKLYRDCVTFGPARAAAARQQTQDTIAGARGPGGIISTGTKKLSNK